MRPLYFNPLDNTGNFIGTNPVDPVGVPVKTSFYPYFNPSIYQSFTFYSFPLQTLFSTVLLGTWATNYKSVPVGGLASIGVGGVVVDNGKLAYSTMEFFSYLDVSCTQFSTFETFYASYYQLQPVTYSVRFGTELQPLIASTRGAIDTWNTYEFCLSQQFYYYSYTVITWTEIAGDWLYLDNRPIPGLYSNVTQSGVFSQNAISSSLILSDGATPVGSSSFVNIMGSNVYTGLIDTTNSIIIYQNEQVSSYYSQSLSYQVNIANLTSALNSVAGTGPAASGAGLITVTTFSWQWESTPQGWTGSQDTTFPGYLGQMYVNNYLSNNYGGFYIINSTIAVTQIQSLITVQNNDLANSQTFMNNSVTTLQSQVSLAGQIIGTLQSIMQSIDSNI